jgi:hypothetical protein
MRKLNLRNVITQGFLSATPKSIPESHEYQERAAVNSGLSLGSDLEAESMSSTYACLFLSKLDESGFSILFFLPQEKKSAYHSINPVLANKSFLIIEHTVDRCRLDTSCVLHTWRTFQKTEEKMQLFLKKCLLKINGP